MARAPSLADHARCLGAAATRLGRVAVVATTSGLRRHLMLLPDMLDDRENWRRLRIWLRHKAPKATGASRIRSADPGQALPC